MSWCSLQLLLFYYEIVWQSLSLICVGHYSFTNFHLILVSSSIHSWNLGAESSNKLIRSITLNRSTSSRSSSCKSLVSCSSKSSSTWTESKNDLFDDYGGMESGSHSLTLGRLYAWEKKLYEEVKVNLILKLSSSFMISS